VGLVCGPCCWPFLLTIFAGQFYWPIFQANIPIILANISIFLANFPGQFSNFPGNLIHPNRAKKKKKVV
jgi:hypothetical protein